MKQLKDLFLRNEIKKLVQHNKNQVVILCVVFTLLIIALNQSIFGLQKINEKYSNPFVNYIQVTTPTRTDGDLTRKELVDSIIKDFSQKNIQSKYHIDDVKELRFQYLYFINPETSKKISKKARTYKVNDALYNEVTNSKSANLIQVTKLDSSLMASVIEEGTDADTATLNQYNIIITESICHELGYDPATIKVIPMLLYDNRYILLPVKSVVKSLPQFCDALVSEELAYMQQFETGNKDWIKLAKGLKFSVISASDSSKVLKNVESLPNFQNSKPDIEVIAIDQSQKLYRYIYTFNSFDQDKPKIADEVAQNLGKSSGIYPAYYLNYTSDLKGNSEFAGDFLEFRFNNLDSIKAFQKYCQEQYKMETDMQLINIRHLFAEVGSISKVLGAGFLIFSILMLGIFTNSFISKHIEDIKPNLGTLMAYGMPVKLINNTYLNLIFIIYAFALVVAIVLSLILSLLLSWLFKIGFTWTPWIIAGLLVLIILTIWYAKNIISKIFTNTPGDLIYKR